VKALPREYHRQGAKPRRKWLPRKALTLLGVMAVDLVPSAYAVAADPPARPIRFVVPFPPGTTTDVVARLAAQRLNRQIVIDNRPGASGTIGVETVARAAPDGHTWCLGTTSTHALAPLLNARLGYDPLRDFAPAALLGDAPYFLTTHPGLPAGSLREFIAWARAQPGKVSYASVGNFSLGHLTGELLKRASGIDMVHVPYKGSNLALVDLLAGRIELNVSTIPASLPQVRAGKLRALAVTSRARMAALPQTPTVAESGLPGFYSALWVGVYLPARTPAALTSAVNREFAAALKPAEVRNALVEQGFEPADTTPEALARLTRDDMARWRKLIAEAGLKPEQ